MSRASDRDFASILEFVKNYTLLPVCQDVAAIAAMKSVHKRYLALLQVWAICAARLDEGCLPFFETKMDRNSMSCAHLRETVSDIGSGLFCALHGAYKPAHMCTRSAIENFVRFSASAFNAQALTVTSVYALFDLAKETHTFSGERARHLHSLHQQYGELCKYTHSASLAHMSGIHALAHFPSLNVADLEEWIRITTNTMTEMVATILASRPATYLEAHFTAKELIDPLIPQKLRLQLLRGK